MVVWRQQAWMRVMWTLQAWKENQEMKICTLQVWKNNYKMVRWHPLLPLTRMECQIWGSARLHDTVTSTKPKVFERKSFLSESWSNNKIKEIKPKDLNCSSFEPLLAEKIRCPSMRMNNSERIRIYQESFQWVTIPFEHSFVMPSPCLKFPQKWLKNSGT